MKSSSCPRWTFSLYSETKKMVVKRLKIRQEAELKGDPVLGLQRLG